MALAVAVVVVVAGYGAYAYLENRAPSGEPTLVVYTYASLFGGTCGGTPAFDQVFGGFALAHHVHLNVECPAGTLSSTLIAQRNAPGADLVVGLDEVTATQAADAGALVPYLSPQLSDVPVALVHELSPTHDVTPYEFGYLALDYNSAFANATSGSIATSNFSTFAANTTWAKSLIVEDPTTDITGEEMLLWQIEFATQVEHTDWRTFWQATDRDLSFAPDWSTAFGEFAPAGAQPQAVVSYSTDPAYAADTTPGQPIHVTLSTDHGRAYGWKTIYGIGIVHGSAHLGLDQEFVDWFLHGSVQSQIPTNEWEYPANATVALPSVYQAALDPANITALNDGTSPMAIAAGLSNWLNEWQAIENQYG
ncbi:MAG: thiamine ABC transporter substrate-binding protein [Thermoplasmata archaeon]